MISAERRKQLFHELEQRGQAVIDSASADDYLECVVGTSLEDKGTNGWLVTAFQAVTPFPNDRSGKALDASVFAALTVAHPIVRQEISRIQKAIMDYEGIVIHQNGDETIFAIKRAKLDDLKTILGLPIQVNRVLTPEKNGLASVSLPSSHNYTL